MIETNWSRDGLRLKIDNLRRSCRLQDGDAVHRIREHDAFLGHEMKGPAGDWTWWRLDGWGAGRPRRNEGEWGEGPSLAITAMFCSEFAYVFWLSVSMSKVAGEHPFCVLIYMNSCIFHIYFIVFILLSYLIFDFVCLTLSLADTHGKCVLCNTQHLIHNMF